MLSKNVEGGMKLSLFSSNTGLFSDDLEGFYINILDYWVNLGRTHTLRKLSLILELEGALKIPEPNSLIIQVETLVFHGSGFACSHRVTRDQNSGLRTPSPVFLQLHTVPTLLP